jgi:predicted esterase
MREQRSLSVCLLAVCTFLTAFFLTHDASAEERRRTASGAVIMAVPPQNRGGKQPVFVYLHGIKGDPSSGCVEFARSVNSYGWLVCPQGNVRNPGRTYSWGGTLEAQWHTVQEAVAAVKGEPEVDADAKVVLLGFSQGGYLAANLIRGYPHKIGAAVIIGANVRFTKDELVKAGVGKVGFAAGRGDGTFAYMQESARKLEVESFASQFHNLGKVGHTYVGANAASRIDALISWIATD